MKALLTVAAVLVCGAAAPAQTNAPSGQPPANGAASTPGNSSPADGDTDSIALAGQVVIRLRATEGGQTPAQRADAIRERLIPVLSLRHLTIGRASCRERV